MKILIAYFSRKGNNYVNGSIVNLQTGNTKAAADKLQSITGGDLFEIQTVNSYSEDYFQCTEEAKKELNENARPELKEKISNMDDYDVIFLGYPNWWSTMPMGVFTFLESYDLKNKNILPFCTHEGSGMGRSETDIKNLCPDSVIFDGLALKGGSVGNCEQSLKNWINKINLFK
jgi:flavodoxin